MHPANTIFERIIGVIVTWLLFFPLLLLLGTPFILIISLFGKSMPYSQRVKSGYSKVWDWWDDHGIWMIPW